MKYLRLRQYEKVCHLTLLQVRTCSEQIYQFRTQIQQTNICYNTFSKIINNVQEWLPLIPLKVVGKDNASLSKTFYVRVNPCMCMIYGLPSSSLLYFKFAKNPSVYPSGATICGVLETQYVGNVLWLCFDKYNWC